MPPNTPNSGNQLRPQQNTDTLYLKRVRPAISTIVSGTRTVVGDTLNGIVPITGDALLFTGRAGGYLLGKAGLTVAQSIHEVLNGVSGNNFGGKLFGEKTKANKNQAA